MKVQTEEKFFAEVKKRDKETLKAIELEINKNVVSYEEAMKVFESCYKKYHKVYEDLKDQ